MFAKSLNVLLRKFVCAAFTVQLIAAVGAYAQTTDELSSSSVVLCDTCNSKRDGLIDRITKERAKANAPNALSRIESQAEFDSIARIHDAGTLAAIPHAMFVIDRSNRQVHYVNTTRFAFHEDFLRGERLVLNLDHATLESFYLSATRRFILGTVSFHPDLNRWLFEYWDGDQVTAELLRETDATLAATFFKPLTFKANSTQQERTAKAAQMAMITQSQIVAQRSYLALNTGKALGRLRILAKLDAEEEDDIAPTDIVVLNEAPLTLPPVAGVIMAQPSTALSHVNLLARGWGIPNIYLQDALNQLRTLNGQWVLLHADRNSYSLEKTGRPASIPLPPTVTLLSQPDLTRHTLIPLAQLSEKDTARCGAKAARLGTLEKARQQGRLGSIAPIPDGFCIPYAQFVAFMAQPQAQALIKRALATRRFDQSSAVRRQALERLRAELVKLPVPGQLAQEWSVRWQDQLAGKGVFARSSSNSEDLSNFSGAGLYTTVPNVTGQAALELAVKTVWASVYNAQAFEARRVARLPHNQAQMAVFVQTAIAPRASGVMITRDPFDQSRQRVVYVAAKRGVGIRVVEGKRIAEQSLYDTWSKAVQRFSRSGEVTELQLDENGGLKEIPTDPARDVLSDEQVRLLAETAVLVKASLGDQTEQDIEWAFDIEGRIVLLQARPYIDAQAQR
ncbi:MAG: PEP/pyruvate-binding domain-containing protein [Betaproteobacteria bacterium]|nr:PEP/pyruvate-binding domain-containing protein [Betaproteobacteria bacterium]